MLLICTAAKVGIRRKKFVPLTLCSRITVKAGGSCWKESKSGHSPEETSPIESPQHKFEFVNAYVYTLNTLGLSYYPPLLFIKQLARPVLNPQGTFNGVLDSWLGSLQVENCLKSPHQFPLYTFLFN